MNSFMNGVLVAASSMDGNVLSLEERKQKKEHVRQSFVFCYISHLQKDPIFVFT